MVEKYRLHRINYSKIYWYDQQALISQALFAIACTLTDEEIDGEVLSALDDEQKLLTLGIKKMGTRLKLVQKIRDLVKTNSTQQVPPWYKHLQSVSIVCPVAIGSQSSVPSLAHSSPAPTHPAQVQFNTAGKISKAGQSLPESSPPTLAQSVHA